MGFVSVLFLPSKPFSNPSPCPKTLTREGRDCQRFCQAADPVVGGNSTNLLAQRRDGMSECTVQDISGARCVNCIYLWRPYNTRGIGSLPGNRIRTSGCCNEHRTPIDQICFSAFAWLVAEEAGATLSDLYGGPMRPDSLVVSTPGIHEELLKALI